ncbi:hypothetical protein HETIRDRAFT_428578 [Heterobasidion irregulare TC 32-1]|uniref:Tyr recombinase domain-containing protein n=1 Tax=Heterobasidion irregulare (strain TC 32-1) TaxID=747525 RepID=W4K066_HETIT|nr:uncharacterized protein HETIRDRAFT_428578 [Heterobasidion irregulare TC 32-1]ETW78730.1 hypothetical protein HETIRDRAFT_428578 [Heterobasidion irregulare TC 32-1]
MAHGWKDSTLKVYGSGLLLYHVICDAKDVPETHRALASIALLCSFLSALAGSYSPSTVENYLAGIRAWHLIHGLEWSHDTARLTSLQHGTKNLAPPSAKKTKRAPYTVTYLLQLRPYLNLSDSVHTAVWACVTALFYGIACVGELTVPSLSGFKLDIHTKTSTHGQEIYWSSEPNPTDPDAALRHHLLVKKPSPNEHLFSNTFKKERRPLLHSVFLRYIAQAAAQAGLPPLHGHSFRIGGTLEFLLRGLPFDTIQVKGRWVSNTFQAYLHCHAEIMMVHIQSNMAVHWAFVHYTLPPAL